MKKILLLGAAAVVLAACGNKPKTQNETGQAGQNAEYTQYLDTLKADNNLKITMGKVPVTIVGKLKFIIFIYVFGRKKYF